MVIWGCYLHSPVWISANLCELCKNCFMANCFSSPFSLNMCKITPTISKVFKWSVSDTRTFQFFTPGISVTTWCFRIDSRLAPSQWVTSLQSNAVSHWLGANIESVLVFARLKSWTSRIIPSGNETIIGLDNDLLPLRRLNLSVIAELSTFITCIGLSIILGYQVIHAQQNLSNIIDYPEIQMCLSCILVLEYENDENAHP